MPGETNPYLTSMYRRAFSSQDPALVQVSFEADVLDRYRQLSGYSLIRTDTVGRVRREGGWTLDVGIGEGERTVHACLHDLLHVLPDEERDHWAQHAVALPMSQRFLQMRLAPGSCFDDGDIREW